MRELNTTETWNDDDDAFLRGALLSLRADVDASPLTDPEGARSQGDASRRRRMLGLTAGVAAAVAIVAALGFRGLTQEDALPPPQPATPTPTLETTAPTRTTTPTPTTSPSATSATVSGSASPTSTSRPTSTPNGSLTPSGTPIGTGPAGGLSGGAPVIATAGTDERTPKAALFIPIGTWQQAVYGSSLTVSSGLGDFESSPSMFPCDHDTETNPGFGIGMYRNTSAELVGRERIRSYVPTETEANVLVDFYLRDMRTALNGPCTHPSFTISTTRGPGTDTWRMELTDPSGGREVNFIALAKVGYGRAATIVINETNGRTDSQMFSALSSLKQAAASRGE